MTTIDDALDGLPARELERLRARIDKRLQACAICGQDGAIACRVDTKLGGGPARFAILLCRRCIEANRLPEGRSVGGDG